MTYTSIGKQPRACTVQPVRLLYADHDWFMWAWENDGRSGGQPKLWKLARMDACTPARINTVPSFLEQEADAAEAAMFRSTSHQRR